MAPKPPWETTPAPWEKPKSSSSTKRKFGSPGGSSGGSSRVDDALARAAKKKSSGGNAGLWDNAKKLPGIALGAARGIPSLADAAITSSVGNIGALATKGVNKFTPFNVTADDVRKMSPVGRTLINEALLESVDRGDSFGGQMHAALPLHVEFGKSALQTGGRVTNQLAAFAPGGLKPGEGAYAQAYKDGDLAALLIEDVGNVALAGRVGAQGVARATKGAAAGSRMGKVNQAATRVDNYALGLDDAVGRAMFKPLTLPLRAANKIPKPVTGKTVTGHAAASVSKLLNSDRVVDWRLSKAGRAPDRVGLTRRANEVMTVMFNSMHELRDSPVDAAQKAYERISTLLDGDDAKTTAVQFINSGVGSLFDGDATAALSRLSPDELRLLADTMVEGASGVQKAADKAQLADALEVAFQYWTGQLDPKVIGALDESVALVRKHVADPDRAMYLSQKGRSEDVPQELVEMLAGDEMLPFERQRVIDAAATRRAAAVKALEAEGKKLDKLNDRKSPTFALLDNPAKSFPAQAARMNAAADQFMDSKHVDLVAEDLAGAAPDGWMERVEGLQDDPAALRTAVRKELERQMEGRALSVARGEQLPPDPVSALVEQLGLTPSMMGAGRSVRTGQSVVRAAGAEGAARQAGKDAVRWSKAAAKDRQKLTSILDPAALDARTGRVDTSTKKLRAAMVRELNAKASVKKAEKRLAKVREWAARKGELTDEALRASVIDIRKGARDVLAAVEKDLAGQVKRVYEGPIAVSPSFVDTVAGLDAVFARHGFEPGAWKSSTFQYSEGGTNFRLFSNDQGSPIDVLYGDQARAVGMNVDEWMIEVWAPTVAPLLEMKRLRRKIVKTSPANWNLDDAEVQFLAGDPETYAALLGSAEDATSRLRALRHSRWEGEQFAEPVETGRMFREMDEAAADDALGPDPRALGGSRVRDVDLPARRDGSGFKRIPEPDEQYRFTDARDRYLDALKRPEQRVAFADIARRMEMDPDYQASVRRLFSEMGYSGADYVRVYRGQTDPPGDFPYRNVTFDREWASRFALEIGTTDEFLVRVGDIIGVLNDVEAEVLVPTGKLIESSGRDPRALAPGDVPPVPRDGRNMAREGYDTPDQKAAAGAAYDLAAAETSLTRRQRETASTTKATLNQAGNAGARRAADAGRAAGKAEGAAKVAEREAKIAANRAGKINPDATVAAQAVHDAATAGRAVKAARRDIKLEAEIAKTSNTMRVIARRIARIDADLADQLDAATNRLESLPASYRPAGSMIRDFSESVNHLLEGTGGLSVATRSNLEQVAAGLVIDTVGLLETMPQRPAQILGGSLAKGGSGPRGVALAKTAAEHVKTGDWTMVSLREQFALSVRQKTREAQNHAAKVLRARYGKTVAELLPEHFVPDPANPGKFLDRPDPDNPGQVLPALTGDEIARLVNEKAAWNDKWVPWNPKVPAMGRSVADNGNVARIRPDTTFIPQYVLDAFEGYTKQAEPGLKDLLLPTFDATQRVWKHGVLALSNVWHTGNIAGNILMAWMGGVALSDMPGLVKDARAMHARFTLGEPLPGDAPSRLYGVGLSQDAQKQLVIGREGSDVTRRELGNFKGSNRLQRRIESKDTPTTAAGKVVSEARDTLAHPIQKSYDFNGTIDDFTHLVVYLDRTQKKGLSPEKALADSLKIAGDFTRMTPLERGTFRRLMPFYSWMRHITSLSAHLAVNHPLRTAWTMHLWTMFADDSGDNSDIPWMAGAIPMQKKDRFINAGNMIPFASAFDVTEGFTDPAGFLTASMGPLPKLALETLTGIKAGPGGLEPMSQPNGGTLADDGTPKFGPIGWGPAAQRATRLLPQTRALVDLFGRRDPADRVVRYDTGERRKIRGRYVPDVNRQSNADIIRRDLLRLPFQQTTTNTAAVRAGIEARKKRAASGG